MKKMKQMYSMLTHVVQHIWNVRKKIIVKSAWKLFKIFRGHFLKNMLFMWFFFNIISFPSTEKIEDCLKCALEFKRICEIHGSKN